MPVVIDEARAWRPGQDARVLARQLAAAHEAFLTTGRPASSVRPLVASSWRRCLDDGVDPEHASPPIELVDGELDEYRDAHPLASVMPVVRRLLLDDAVETGLLVAVSDAAGRLLWVEGRTAARKEAERIRFVEGACWSELRAGTNAPGTALALDREVQIFASEHLSRSVTRWSCTAVPIHDPDSGAVLGVLDLTGGDDVAAPHTLALVRATVAAAEGELRVRRLTGTSPAPTSVVPNIRALGRPVVGVGDGTPAQRLSLRHSELLVLLAAHPEGLSGDQLAVALHEQEHAPVTVRAELSRLRRILGPSVLHSRPYRLAPTLRSDVEAVRQLIDRGQVAAALDLYVGPLLPSSIAPGVVKFRDDLHERVRRAVLAQRDADLLLRFAGAGGCDDWVLWSEAARWLPDGAVLAGVRSHLRRLDRDLGSARRGV